MVGVFGIGYHTDSDNFGIGIRTTDNNYNYNYYANPGDGQWHNLTMVYLAETKTLYTYFDGGASSGNMVLGGDQTFGNVDYISIGNGRTLYGNSDIYEGKIRNAKIYNRALSAAEVKSLYDKGR
ncbi:LamG domain-containing protein [Patescibacteria group bacterium]|nr:LamG domain-containing protein [Patescibacteria group bacterium]